MQIRRNYRQSVFRPKRDSGRLRLLILSVIFTGVMGAVLVNQPQVVGDTFEQFFGTPPTSTPFASTIATRANEAFLMGNTEEALRLYEQAIEQRPDVSYLYEYGQILVDLNRPEEALEVARRIVDVAPGDVRGFALRAIAQVWQRDFASAIPVVLTGLQVDDTFAPLYTALSRAYTGNNDWREGVRAGENAVLYGSSDFRAYWAYANSLSSVGAYEEAVRALETAIRLNPTFLPPYFELAFIFLSQDRDREAIDIYDRILGVQPRNARALLRQCEAYIKIGEFERALGLCEDSVDNDPDLAIAQLRLGIMLYTRREFSRARDAFATCATLEPQSLQCAYRLGLADYYLGECELAWNQLQNSLIMAQAQNASTTIVDTIRQGLSAIITDPACPGYGARMPNLQDEMPEGDEIPPPDEFDEVPPNEDTT